MRYAAFLMLVLAVPVLVLAADAKRHSVTISDMAFSPGSVKIAAGDTVVWTNNDDRDHTVSAADGSFQSGNIRPGGSFSYTFRKAGTFAYGCKYHPRMRGAVVVGP